MSKDWIYAVLDADLTRRRFLYGSGVVAGAGLLAACGQLSDSSRSAGGEIKVGYVASLTGATAPYGVQTLNAMKLAARDLNAHGGIMGRKVAINAVDNQSKPEAVPPLMRQLVSDGNHLLFGASASGTTIVAAQTADQIRVPLIVPMEAADAIIGSGRRYVFKVAPSMLAKNGWAAQALRATIQAADRSGRKPSTAIIIADAVGAYVDAVQAWKRTLADEFPNVKLLDTIIFDEASTSDYAPLVSRAQAANPDLLVFGGNPPSAFQFYPALKRSGWTPRATIGCIGGNTNTKFIQNVGSIAEDDIAGNYWTPKLKGKDGSKFSPQQFFDSYKAAYSGQEPDGVGAFYYACMGLAADAITAAGTADDSEKITKALRSIDIPGISGDKNGMFIVGEGAKFDDKGMNTRAEALVTQIQNGQYIPVFPEPVATSSMVYPRPGSR